MRKMTNNNHQQSLWLHWYPIVEPSVDLIAPGCGFPSTEWTKMAKYQWNLTFPASQGDAKYKSQGHLNIISSSGPASIPQQP